MKNEARFCYCCNSFTTKFWTNKKTGKRVRTYCHECNDNFTAEERKSKVSKSILEVIGTTINTITE